MKQNSKNKKYFLKPENRLQVYALESLHNLEKEVGICKERQSVGK